MDQMPYRGTAARQGSLKFYTTRQRRVSGSGHPEIVVPLTTTNSLRLRCRPDHDLTDVYTGGLLNGVSNRLGDGLRRHGDRSTSRDLCP